MENNYLALICPTKCGWLIWQNNDCSRHVHELMTFRGTLYSPVAIVCDCFFFGIHLRHENNRFFRKGSAPATSVWVFLVISGRGVIKKQQKQNRQCYRKSFGFRLTTFAACHSSAWLIGLLEPAEATDLCNFDAAHKLFTFHIATGGGGMESTFTNVCKTVRYADIFLTRSWLPVTCQKLDISCLFFYKKSC